MNYNMEEEHIDISVIIPHRNSIKTLDRLFDSIPVSDRIEIILVDNSPTRKRLFSLLGCFRAVCRWSKECGCRARSW